MKFVLVSLRDLVVFSRTLLESTGFLFFLFFLFRIYSKVLEFLDSMEEFYKVVNLGNL